MKLLMEFFKSFYIDVSNQEIYDALVKSCKHWKEDCVNYSIEKYVSFGWKSIKIGGGSCPLCLLFIPKIKFKFTKSRFGNHAGCPLKEFNLICCKEWDKVSIIQSNWYAYETPDFIKASKEMLKKLEELKDEYALLVEEDKSKC